LATLYRICQISVATIFRTIYNTWQTKYYWANKAKKPVKTKDNTKASEMSRNVLFLKLFLAQQQ
jgi:hypothetical protein